MNPSTLILGFSGGSVGKEYACNTRDQDLNPGSAPHTSMLAGKSQRQRSLESSIHGVVISQTWLRDPRRNIKQLQSYQTELIWHDPAYLLNHSVCAQLDLLFGLSRWLRGKESSCQCRRHEFNPWVRKIPWRRKWQHTAVFLPAQSYAQRSLEGYSSQDLRVGHDWSNLEHMWIKTNCGQFFKRWEYQTTLLVSWEICMQGKKQ